MSVEKRHANIPTRDCWKGEHSLRLHLPTVWGRGDEWRQAKTTANLSSHKKNHIFQSDVKREITAVAFVGRQGLPFRRRRRRRC